jgi:hypothetical protein
VALRVSFEHVDADSATTKRAQSYLRWYPSPWRERYGEEFVAHLEIELSERPFSLARSSDIVAHGLLARFSFQRRLRIALSASAAAVLVTIGIAAAISSVHYWAPVSISNYGGGSSGVGEPAAPSQVSDLSFSFTTSSRAAIRITSVKLVPLHGFLTPKLVGVEFAPHYTVDANDTGWPVRLTNATPTKAQGRARLVQAIGTTVTLARSDVLWLGLRASKLHHAYAIEGVRVTYEHRGISHTMVIDQATTPDVLCASSSRSVNMPNWCSQEILNAHVTASLERFHSATEQAPSNEATMIAQFALNEVQDQGYGIPTIVELRRWAARLFPAGDPDGVRSITTVLNGDTPEWRFVIRSVSSHAVVVRCMSRGQVDPAGGVTEAGVLNITNADVKSCSSPQRP